MTHHVPLIADAKIVKRMIMFIIEIYVSHI